MKIDFANLKQLIPFFNAYEVFYIKMIFILKFSFFFSKFVNFFSATIPEILSKPIGKRSSYGILQKDNGKSTRVQQKSE
jgi:hypothetical protein